MVRTTAKLSPPRAAMMATPQELAQAKEIRILRKKLQREKTIRLAAEVADATAQLRAGMAARAQVGHMELGDDAEGVPAQETAASSAGTTSAAAGSAQEQWDWGGGGEAAPGALPHARAVRWAGTGPGRGQP
jgi:hypothetical protein